MGSARKEFHDKAQAYLEHFKVCQGKSYESSEYQKHFDMADDLIRFVLDNFKAGKLNGKDFFETELELDLLFPVTKDEVLKKDIAATKPSIDTMIQDYIENK